MLQCAGSAAVRGTGISVRLSRCGLADRAMKGGGMAERLCVCLKELMVAG